MDVWKTLKKAVSVGAPILANAIVPGSGGVAAALISSVLGVSADDPTAMLEAVRTASPEQWVELKRIQEENRIRLVELGIETEMAYLVDRQDARKRDIQINQAGHENTRANWMILGDVVGLIVCLMVIYLLRDATGNGVGEVRGLLTAVASYFGLGLRDAHQFEFGSSRGEKIKDLKVPTGTPAGTP